MDFPLLIIFNDASSRRGNPFGLGDTDYSIKYNFRKETEGSKWPALTASLNIEPPTIGSVPEASTRFGSDRRSPNWNSSENNLTQEEYATLANAGATFAGNTLTGAVGIRRGARSSPACPLLTHQFTRKFDVGVEVFGATQQIFL